MAGQYNARLLGLPLAITSMALVWVFALWVLKRRPFGRYVYAVGGREEVAALRLCCAGVIWAGASSGAGGRVILWVRPQRFRL